MKNAFLYISEIQGQIPLSFTEINHIGKREIVNSAKIKIDVKEFTTLSSIRRDNTGEVVKEQFNIRYLPKEKCFVIEDRNSTNGTYLGNINLKHIQAQKLSHGDTIIVPIERNGQLTQLQMVFYDESSSQEVIDKNLTSNPVEKSLKFPKYRDPTANPTVSPSKEVSSSGGVYFDPTFEPTVPPTSQNSKSSYSASSQNAQYIPYDPDDNSASFILIRQKIDIPDNCFDPQIAQDAGLDFSMVYKLEKGELWHIMVAFTMLFVMIYHTYINILLITSLISRAQTGFGLSASEIFITPLPTAIMFCVAFIAHELAHLYTGKYFKFQSRFCLVSKGVKLTVIALLIGIPIGLPGAAVSVGVDPDEDKDKMGAIKMAGPAMNLILGAICILAYAFIPLNFVILKTTFLQGAGLNFMLGGFNLIPKEFKGFAMDGKFIIKWKKGLYFGLLITIVIGYIGVILLTTFSPLYG